MSRIITMLLLFVATQAVNAQQEAEEKAIKKVIGTFFDGLYKGDSLIMKTVLHKDLKTQTTYTNRQGEDKVVSQNRKDLLTGVSKKNPSDVYDEKLLSYTIRLDGNLASVWTPYEFYLNGKFRHCGANSFQLFKNNGKWEIIYLVDSRRRGSCKALKDKK